MSRMLATSVHAVETSILRSQSFASRRQRPSHAKVRSTTHRRGRTTNPFAVSQRLMISIFHSPCSAERLAQFRAGIGAIGKKMTQPGETVANGLYEIACAVAILNVGCMNDHEQHQSDRVGNDVTFAALDLLSGVITANTATFRGFKRFGCRSRRPSGWVRDLPVHGC